MELNTDQDTLIMIELEKLLDAPKECENVTHGDPDWEEYHDKEAAQWYLLGTHSCGRVTGIYACDTFVSMGSSGQVVIECYTCGEQNIPFTEFYKTITKI